MRICVCNPKINAESVLSVCNGFCAHGIESPETQKRRETQNSVALKAAYALQMAVLPTGRDFPDSRKIIEILSNFVDVLVSSLLDISTIVEKAREYIKELLEKIENK